MRSPTGDKHREKQLQKVSSSKTAVRGYEDPLGLQVASVPLNGQGGFVEEQGLVAVCIIMVCS